LLVIAASVAVAGCRDARPWQQDGWRPAQPPQRIVAASLFATEVLLAIAPRDRIAAVHMLAASPLYSTVAGEVHAMRLVGADPEQLLAPEPDLVICDPFTKAETLALLSAAAVPVVRTGDPWSFADIGANVRQLGAWCHLEGAAEALVATMEARLQVLAARAPELAAWRVVNLDGALHTHGHGSLFAATLAAAGARSLAAERGVGAFRKLDLETVLAWQPDALVVGGARPEGGVPAWLLQHPGLSLLDCVQRRRIVHVPGPLLGTTSHLLVGAAERLQEELLRLGRP
jgi:iron complex transport system substrate-binding protein